MYGSCQRSAGITARYASAAALTIARMAERSSSRQDRMDGAGSPASGPSYPGVVAGAGRYLLSQGEVAGRGADGERLFTDRFRIPRAYRARWRTRLGSWLIGLNRE